MKRTAIGWALIAIAGVAGTIAILEGAYLTFALPAAALAVVAATLVFVGGWSERAEEPAERRDEPATASDRMHRAMRSALRTGRMGREEIVATLDRVERQFLDPLLSPAPVEELQRVAQLSYEQFLEYLRARLDRLEAGL